MCATASLRSAGGVWALFFLPDALVPLRLFAAGRVLGGDVKVFVISTMSWPLGCYLRENGANLSMTYGLLLSWRVGWLILDMGKIIQKYMLVATDAYE